MGKLLTALGVLAIVAFAVAMFVIGPSTDYGWASLPAEMDGVLHVDMASLAATPFFQELMRREDPARAGVQRWAEITEKTGFDPLTDLHSLTIGGIGDAEDPTSAVYAIVEGDFDRERLFAHFETEGAMEQFREGNRELWSFETETASGTWHGRVAWLTPGTAVIGSAAHFDTLLAAMDGSGQRVEGTPLGTSFSSLDGEMRFAVLVPEAFRREMAAKADGAAAMMTAPLQAIESVLFDLDVDSGVDMELSLTTADADDGKQLYDMLNGYMAMGKMFAASQPEAAEAFEALQLEHDGTRISLTLALSGEQIWSAVDSAQLQ